MEVFLGHSWLLPCAEKMSPSSKSPGDCSNIPLLLSDVSGITYSLQYKGLKDILPQTTQFIPQSGTTWIFKSNNEGPWQEDLSTAFFALTTSATFWINFTGFSSLPHEPIQSAFSFHPSCCLGTSKSWQCMDALLPKLLNWGPNSLTFKALAELTELSLYVKENLQENCSLEDSCKILYLVLLKGKVTQARITKH